MAIVFDSANSANGGANTVASVTVPNTISDNTKGMVVAGGMICDPSGATMSATYDGTSMTSVIAKEDSNGDVRAHMFRLLAPPTGAKNCVVSVSANRRMVAGVQAYTDIDQSTPLGTPVTAADRSQTASATVTGVISGSLVIAIVAKRNNSEAITLSAGTERYNNVTTAGANNNNVVGAGAERSGTGSVAMTWTWTTNNRGWALIAVEMFEDTSVTITADFPVPVERLLTARRDTAASLDWCGTLRRDNGVVEEWRSSLQRGHEVPFEMLQGARHDPLIAWESRGMLTASALLAWESRASFQRDQALVIESLLARHASLVFPIEELLGLRGDLVLPFDTRGTTQHESIIPVEWRGALMVVTDAGIPVEFGTGAGSTLVLSPTWLGTVSIDQGVPPAWLQSLVADRSALIDWLSGVRSDHVARIETRAGIQSDSVLSLDWRIQLARDIGVLPAWQGQVVRDQPLVLEALGAVQRGSLVASVEALAGVQRGAVVPVEWGGAIIIVVGDAMMPVEWGGIFLNDDDLFLVPTDEIYLQVLGAETYLLVPTGEVYILFSRRNQ